MSQQPWSRRIQYESAAGFRAEHEIHYFEHENQIILIAVDTGATTSITLSIEELISAFCNRYNIKPDIIIEHYAANWDDGEETETFEKVTLNWNEKEQCYKNPNWSGEISREEAETLVGQKLLLDEAPSDASVWIEGDSSECYYCLSKRIIFWNQKHYCARCGNPHSNRRKRVG